MNIERYLHTIDPLLLTAAIAAMLVTALLGAHLWLDRKK